MQANEVDQINYADQPSEGNTNQPLVHYSEELTNDSHSQYIRNVNIEPLSLSEKFRLIPGLLKYMVPLGLVYFFEYAINQGRYFFSLKI